MIPTYLIPWVIRIVLVLGITFSGYLGYNAIKYIGYKEAEVKYTLVIKNYEDNINKKIDSIETLSNTLVTENRTASDLLVSDMQVLKNSIKKNPLIVIKDGKCVPSETFYDSLSKINQRANESIKDNKK